MAQFTTVQKVREAAGFVGNTNVSDAVVAGYIEVATNQVEAKLGDVYQIPLLQNFENTIVFTGTGDSSLSMTITINSVSYVIAITNLMTAAAAANLFRAAVAAESSATFKTDGSGNGATVRLISCETDEDIANVTITSTDPQTVAGITSTGGTAVAVGPPLVQSITTQIAAAYLLIQEYGPESQDTDKGGFDRMGFFDGDQKNPGLLTQIQQKSMKVFDCEGNEITRSGTQQAVFFPTEASRTDTTDPTENRFTMNKVF